MATVHDLAAEVLDAFDHPVSTMKLQKLTYLAQGWSLALRGKPIFNGDFEAWANGPVNRDLFREHRTQYSVGRWRLGDASQLTNDEKKIVRAVIRNYGALSGAELSDLTHVSGTPWANARQRAGAGDGASSRETVTQADMQAHFSKLLRTGTREMRA